MTSILSTESQECCLLISLCTHIPYPLQLKNYSYHKGFGVFCRAECYKYNGIIPFVVRDTRQVDCLERAHLSSVGTSSMANPRYLEL